jgi:hypothetical protein
VLVALLLGCVSLSIGCGDKTRLVPSDDGTLVQSGEAKVPGDAELDIFYPAPFAGPPNLTVDDTFNHCVVVSQFPDHFRVKNTFGIRQEMKWTARGVRAVPVVPAVLAVPQTPPPPPPTTDAPAPLPPPAPIPAR